ncbi:MAG: hypothetical protein WBI74_07470 [Caldicoprobacterales bacterium]|jgi:hypothetical protein|nr:hypothetical protein [Clostridiales bacterium]
MAYTNWLDLLILILAVFSVNFVIMHKVITFFSKKPYLVKWGISLIVSLLLVLLHRFLPHSFIFLLVLSITGAIEIINLLLHYKIKENLKVEIELKQLSDIVDLIDQCYLNQNQDKEEKIIENKASSTSLSKKNETRTSKIKEESKLPTKSESKEPKIIKSSRLYALEEFLKESEGQNVILSSNLLSNLEASKKNEKDTK